MWGRLGALMALGIVGLPLVASCSPTATSASKCAQPVIDGGYKTYVNKCDRDINAYVCVGYFGRPVSSCDGKTFSPGAELGNINADNGQLSRLEAMVTPGKIEIYACFAPERPFFDAEDRSSWHCGPDQ